MWSPFFPSQAARAAGESLLEDLPDTTEIIQTSVTIVQELFETNQDVAKGCRREIETARGPICPSMLLFGAVNNARDWSYTALLPNIQVGKY